MKDKEASVLIEKAISTGGGIVRLAPAWVPRSFLSPGGRLKLATQDLYALGAHRGGIDERWFASTTQADNGPGTPFDEGLSYIAVEDGAKLQKVLFRDAIGLLGEAFLGKDVMDKEGGWNVLTKFFDNLGPIPHHMHQNDEFAARVGMMGKPEAYYFPKQLNFTGNRFPYTFFGLEPGTTKDDVIRCLERWDEGDNGILDLSRAYRLKPGTGWSIPAGILHAPGSFVTYEPQRASDVFAMFENMADGKPIGWDMLVKNVPPEHHHDMDYIMSMLDWEANVDPEFRAHYYTEPKPASPVAEMEKEGCVENWISYGSEYFSAKELTVLPGKTVTIVDAAAYGLIVLQGHGKVGTLSVESPAMIRFGQMTEDELFVTADTAKAGVIVCNESDHDELVMLKHFGPGNPDMPARN